MSEDRANELTQWLQERLAEEPMLQWFHFSHLPPHLQPTSMAFAELAYTIAASLPRNPERTVALRKLLEAKDAGVRAKIHKVPTP